MSQSFWFNYQKGSKPKFEVNLKPYQLYISWAFCKIKGVQISKSPVPEILGTGLDSSRCRPWTELKKVEVDEVWFDKSCPTRENFSTDDVFLRAALLIFI